MNCNCNEKAIIIVRGNDTNFNDGNFLTINLNTTILDLSTFKATFKLGSIIRQIDDISSGIIHLNFTAAETFRLPQFCYGTLNLIDTSNRVATIESLIPFQVISVVNGNAIATEPYTLNFDVKQGGETILNVSVESAVTVEVGQTTTLPAGSQATVTNSGTGNHLILNFGIPKGVDGGVYSVNGKVGDVVLTPSDIGAQAEITEENKLNSDLVDDTDSTNKFVSPEEKVQITTNKNDIIGLDQKIDSVSGALSDSITGLDNKYDSITGGLSDSITALDNKYDSVTGALDDKIDSINGALSDSITALDSVVSGNFTTLSDSITALDSVVSANYNTLDGKIDSINGALSDSISAIDSTIGGYGDIVTHNVSEFATAAQGALADTAVQPNDNLSVLTDNSATYPIDKAKTLDGLTATITELNYTDGVTSAIQTQFNSITEKIPSAATSANQLADKNFVNSSIATNTAYFIGTFNSVADLEAYSGTLTNNDYAFVVTTDSLGNTAYDRYKYTTATTPASWQFEYELNNSSFTSDQWAAINSGITSATKVTHTSSTAIGSSTQPVYIGSDGAATAIGYTIEKSVPSDAVFTDTTYEGGSGISIVEAASTLPLEQTLPLSIVNNIVLIYSNLDTSKTLTVVIEVPYGANMAICGRIDNRYCIGVRNNSSGLIFYDTREIGTSEYNQTTISTSGSNAYYVKFVIYSNYTSDVYYSLDGSSYTQVLASSRSDQKFENYGNLYLYEGGSATYTSILAAYGTDIATTPTISCDNTIARLTDIKNATLTIQKNGSTVDTFTANASSDKTINITVPTDNNELTNGAGYITGITSSDVTTALGYTPYNSTNPSGYQANVIETVKVNGTALTPSSKAVDITVPTNNNQLTNGAGYITSSALSGYAQTADLATVATTGDYDDLLNKPYIPSGVVVDQTYDSTSQNAQSGVAIAGAGFAIASNLATVATSGSYNDLSNKPTIPTVNNATLTIQKNGTTVKTFTANASSDVTCNITVPTNNNELTNGAGYITGVTSSDVTTALGYTPYNSSNPNGYTSNTGTVTSVNNVSPVSGNVTLSIPTQAADIGALPITTTINDLTTTAQQNALNSGATTTNIGQIVTNTTDISTINGKIPSQATSSNQLADKAFVNSSIQTATANFRGNWADWATVPSNASDYPEDYAGSKTPTVNDYLVVQDASDYTLDTLDGTWRFKYSGTWATDGKSGWLPEYQVNETPLTSAQIAALDSGITSSGVTLIGTALQPNDNISQLTNNVGYITGITSSDVTTALGFTPYSNANPNGYQANVIETVKVNGTALTPSSKAVDITVPTNNNQLTNGAGYITSSAITNMQTTTNLVTSVSSASTNSQYPSAKLFYDTCGDIETLINAL